MADNWNKFPLSTPNEAGYYLIAYNNILYGKIVDNIVYDVGIWNRMGYWTDLVENSIVVGWQAIEPFG